MNDLSEPLYSQLLMSTEEIIQRFKKVIGREMTPVEREQFLLPPQDPSETV